jgi:DNA-binding HxlR family transcriptional regulator
MTRQERTSDSGAHLEVSPRSRSLAVEAEFADPSCSVRRVLDRVADKWTAQLVAVLSHGPHRFGELRRATPGISEKMLTVTLRGLERDGLVTRTVDSGPPLKVTYELTDLGRTLVEPLAGLVSWARAHGHQLLTAHDRQQAR